MMPQPVALADAPTAGGSLLVLAIVLPVAGVLLGFAIGGRHAERIALALMPAGLAVAIAIAVAVERSGAPLVYVIGGWAPPLGIALRADGLSVVMLVATALLVGGIALFAQPDFRTPADGPEARRSYAFWTLLLGLWGALNAVFLGQDLFNLYVALELLTFGAVPMVCLDGRAETLSAALRYLMFALIGSVLYLLGAVLLYGGYGTLDILLLAGRIHGEPAAWTAAALMTAGLIAKGALFPLHLWLPPAHAGAPAPASAILSALVVKAPFFLVVRLWFDAMPALLHTMSAPALGALGAGAVLFGSVVALRQARLKLLIAYSTVAQIGYLFLMFPLAAGAGPLVSAEAWTGGVLQAISHAFAKASMFTGAGLIAQVLGHDRIAGSARHRAGAADDGIRAWACGAVAHGAAPERRVLGKVAVDVGVHREPAMVVGGRHARRRAARGRLYLPGRGADVLRRRCTAFGTRSGAPMAGGGGPRASGLLGAAWRRAARSAGPAAGRPPAGCRGHAPMSAAALLLVAAPVLPGVLAAACISAAVRRWMPLLLILAPVPALLAALTAAGAPLVTIRSGIVPVTLALDLPAALLLGTAALLWIGAAAYAVVERGGGVAQRPLRGVLAADARGQLRRLHRRRPRELLPGLRAGQHSRLRTGRLRRYRARPACRCDLHGVHRARRDGAADRLRAARGGGA